MSRDITVQLKASIVSRWFFPHTFLFIEGIFLRHDDAKDYLKNKYDDMEEKRDVLVLKNRDCDWKNHAYWKIERHSLDNFYSKPVSITRYFWVITKFKHSDPSYHWIMDANTSEENLIKKVSIIRGLVRDENWEPWNSRHERKYQAVNSKTKEALDEYYITKIVLFEDFISAELISKSEDKEDDK